MVVNYDVPDLGPNGDFRPDIETYIHRIGQLFLPLTLMVADDLGRTGRFGRKGCSVIFAHDHRSMSEVQEIADTLGKPMRRINATSQTDLEQLEIVSDQLAPQDL